MWLSYSCVVIHTTDKEPMTFVCFSKIDSCNSITSVRHILTPHTAYIVSAALKIRWEINSWSVWYWPIVQQTKHNLLLVFSTGPQTWHSADALGCFYQRDVAEGDYRFKLVISTWNLGLDFKNPAPSWWYILQHTGGGFRVLCDHWFSSLYQCGHQCADLFFKAF